MRCLMKWYDSDGLRACIAGRSFSPVDGRALSVFDTVGICFSRASVFVEPALLHAVNVIMIGDGRHK